MWSVESSVDVAAPVSAVWHHYVTPETWPAWAHSTAAATAEGPLAVGAIVSVRPPRGPVQRVRVATIEPHRRLQTELPLPGATMQFTYEVEPTSAGCRVRHRVGLIGPLASVFGLFMRERNQQKLAVETARLATVVATDREPRPRSMGLGAPASR